MKSAEISRLLPEVFRANLRENELLDVLLDVMEQQHARTEQTLEHLDACFDPRRADDRLVPMLARWVDLGRLFVRSADDVSVSTGTTEVISTGHGRLRELVGRAAYLSQWRGTRVGMIAFLETATGATGFRIDEFEQAADGTTRPFHICVVVPPGLEAHRVLIERIVEFEKPAYVTSDIHFTNSTGT